MNNTVENDFLDFHTTDVLSPFISFFYLLLSFFHNVILIDSSTGSPVHVLMLSILFHCLSRLRTPDILTP